MKNKLLHVSSPKFNVNERYPTSILLKDEYTELVHDEYHTSLGDISKPTLVSLIDQFAIINFIPDKFDQDSDIYNETKILLNFFRHTKKVTNYNVENIKNYLDMDVTKNSKEKTLWVYGCSHSHGVGLNPGEKKYADILAREIKVNLKLITKPGSSLDWSFRHLINSEIQKDDIVVWQLTSPNRLTYNNQEISLGLTKEKHLVETFSDKFQFFKHNSILNAGVQFLKSKNVNFLLMSLLIPNPYFYQYLLEYTKYPQYCYIADYPDLGNDNIHFGPLTHQYIANQALSLLSKL